jgi:hypothetical protein
MSGPGDPPEGTPDGGPGGGEDEYRSVVFDESFVKAARIQEYSARERLGGDARAVRIRHVLPRGLARQAVALVLLIVVAFGFAIYMGVRHPYQGGGGGESEQLKSTVIPLVPTGPVPSVSAASPFAGAPAEHFQVGAQGITLPAPHQVGGFSQTEVADAYDAAKKYLTESGLNTQTVTGGDVRAVRGLLDPGQRDQFDSSLTHPAADGSHEATGWLVRFDPEAHVRLLPGGIRVQGTLEASATSDDALEVAADHTFVYALRGPGSADSPVSLFTVRRQLTFRFSHDDLQQQRIDLVQADVAAGPLACSAAVQRDFKPILAGDSAPRAVTGADPYNHEHPVGAVCAPLTDSATGASRTPATPTATASSASTAPGATTGGTGSANGASSSPAADRTAALSPSTDPTRLGTRPLPLPPWHSPSRSL